MVSNSQNTFVEGKQILDAAMIANEVIDFVQKGKCGGILCKLDMRKCMTMLTRTSLTLLLENMGFGVKWISWIRWCISTMRFSILVNETPSGFFQNSRGLRQQDPLSPYLFVIAMEALSCLLKRAKEGGFLSGWRIRGKGKKRGEISHLLFVDDTLAFCEPLIDQMTYLSWLFMWFKAMSRLRANLEKSILVRRVENLEELV